MKNTTENLSPRIIRSARFVAIALTAIAALRAQPAEVVLQSFSVVSSKGETPSSGVIADSAGNLYGTTQFGGVADQQYPGGAGVVYKIDSTGRETPLYRFKGLADGGSPIGGVIRDAANNLYGTAKYGGELTICNPDNGLFSPSGCGVIYKVDPTGQETVLYSFHGPDGQYPVAGLISDAARNIYGTTSQGGGTLGVVFKLDAAGKETVLHGFTGGSDGSSPEAGVTLDAAGNLYGTTFSGGPGSAGTVYKVDPAGLETVLYSFSFGPEGGGPVSSVVLDAAGNVYGTTEGGGTDAVGVVFKVTPSGQETVLYSFTGGADGGAPQAGVIFDRSGNLYGTTSMGGAFGDGVVYKLDRSGAQTVLFNFDGTDGKNPAGGLIFDAAGDLFGTTGDGGKQAGVVYRLGPTGQETVVYNFFEAGPGGCCPSGGLILDPAGSVYGAAGTGVDLNGIIYKLDASGGESILYNFTGGTDGSGPQGGLIHDAAGNIYGTTLSGGLAVGYQGAGVVYKLSPTGQQTVLHSFTGGADGGSPNGSLVLDPEGNIYGTTYSGGINNEGIVYKLDAGGNQTVLYSFTSETDGGGVESGVVLDAEGNLYGTTGFGGAAQLGTVFEISSAGTFTVLYNFSGLDGAFPVSGVILDAAGNLYGTTSDGGPTFDTVGYGVVYKLDPSGVETVLYNFTGGVDGGQPYAGVIRNAAGDLFGTTYSGGDRNDCYPTTYFPGCGVVYKVDPSGVETVLHTFTGLADGGNSLSVLNFAGGNFFGTTSIGGANYGGVVFKIEDVAGDAP